VSAVETGLQSPRTTLKVQTVLAFTTAQRYKDLRAARNPPRTRSAPCATSFRCYRSSCASPKSTLQKPSSRRITLEDLDQAIKDIRKVARRPTPVRTASCNAAIAKLEKYHMKALYNHWLCVAFSESCKLQYTVQYEIVGHVLMSLEMCSPYQSRQPGWSDCSRCAETYTGTGEAGWGRNVLAQRIGRGIIKPYHRHTTQTKAI
jgi:hypothetical protein